jgi:hypothetical protein
MRGYVGEDIHRFTDHGGQGLTAFPGAGELRSRSASCSAELQDQKTAALYSTTCLSEESVLIFGMLKVSKRT